MLYSERFRVAPGSKPRLSAIDPSFRDKHESKESAEEAIAEHGRRLRELQYLLYAEDRRSVLIILQALDAGGKDGTINRVLGAMNPQGTRVHSFKVPSAEEAAHDFLWRAHLHAPARGEVVIFNRSHYEDVLVVRVHELVPRSVWSKRYDRINDFERNLIDGWTHIIKFFLHISEDEQLGAVGRYRQQRLPDHRRRQEGPGGRRHQSLLAAVARHVDAHPGGTTCPGPQMVDAINDAPNDYPAGDGSNMDNLDFVNASFSSPNASTLRVTMTIKSLSAPPPPVNLGGACGPCSGTTTARPTTRERRAPGRWV